MPIGYTGIVKSVIFQNTTAVAVEAQVLVSSVAAAGNFAFWILSVPPNSAQERTFGVVIVPGDALYAYAAAAGLHIYVSGSVMQGAPYFGPAVGASLLAGLDLPLLEPLPA